MATKNKMPSWLDTGGSGKAFAPKTSSAASSVVRGAQILAGGSSNGSNGRGSGGSSGGGGSSKTTNSQYTAPTLGNTWDANTDYQAIINSAVDNGDYVTAARAEQLRNQKITDSGLNYDLTNNYSGYLNNNSGGGGYAPAGTHNDKDLPANSLAVIEMCKEGYAKAMAEGNTELADYYHATAEAERAKFNYSGGSDGSQYIQLPNAFGAEDIISWNERYDNTNPKEEYNGKYDPKIDALLNEILNRDDFSYDPTDDPLYQQYQQQYLREGDRAMRNTLAEVAAGAGGMNSYAITAAQQANNYYNQQMADKIPELYQLAYQMYLNDKESKVQDLGILQNMDATQYGRYRDTINDWYADKNFAFGAYKTAVDQNNWQTDFDYNSMWDDKIFTNENYWNDKEFTNDNYWKDKEFTNDNYWKDKEFTNDNYWAEKEFDAYQSGLEYDRNKSERDNARALVMWYAENGATSINADLLAKAEMTKAEVDAVIAQVKLDNAGSSSRGAGRRSSSGGGGGIDLEVEDTPSTGRTAPASQGSGNYQSVESAAKEIYSNQGKSAVLNYLKEANATGAIDQSSYMRLYNKYRG